LLYFPKEHKRRLIQYCAALHRISRRASRGSGVILPALSSPSDLPAYNGSSNSNWDLSPGPDPEIWVLYELLILLLHPALQPQLHRSAVGRLITYWIPGKEFLISDLEPQANLCVVLCGFALKRQRTTPHLFLCWLTRIQTGPHRARGSHSPGRTTHRLREPSSRDGCRIAELLAKACMLLVLLMQK
jgi:hypothetical protein